MANHFYSLPALSDTTRMKRSDWVVGTASVGGTVIFEVNIEDNTLSARQVSDALKWLARLAETRDFQVIAPGTLL
jgi:hypothetical protein